MPEDPFLQILLRQNTHPYRPHIPSDVTKGRCGGCSTPLILEKSVSLVGFLTNFLPYRRNFYEIKSLSAEFFEDYTQLCRIFYHFRRIIVPSEFVPPTCQCLGTSLCGINLFRYLPAQYKYRTKVKRPFVSAVI